MNTFANIIGRAVLAGVIAFAGACGGAEDDMEGMEGMPGMSSAADSLQGTGEASSTMRAHMDRMSAMMPDSMLAAMPGHRQMVANMLAQMNREMSSMNMASDAAWTATVDSIRSDLTTMPNLSAAAMATMLPAHRARVERLMSMHEAMMGSM